MNKRLLMLLLLLMAALPGVVASQTNDAEMLRILRPCNTQDADLLWKAVTTETGESSAFRAMNTAMLLASQFVEQFFVRRDPLSDSLRLSRQNEWADHHLLAKALWLSSFPPCREFTSLYLAYMDWATRVEFFLWTGIDVGIRGDHADRVNSALDEAATVWREQ